MQMRAMTTAVRTSKVPRATIMKRISPLPSPLSSCIEPCRQEGRALHKGVATSPLAGGLGCANVWATKGGRVVRGVVYCKCSKTAKHAVSNATPFRRGKGPLMQLEYTDGQHA